MEIISIVGIFFYTSIYIEAGLQARQGLSYLNGPFMAPLESWIWS